MITYMRYFCTSQQTLPLIQLINMEFILVYEYFQTNAAKTFKELDHLLTLKLIAWGKSRHHHKSIKETIKKYFGTKGKSNWIFKTIENGNRICLVYHEDFQIKNFVKVKGESSPYDGNLIYWTTRMGKSAE